MDLSSLRDLLRNHRAARHSEASDENTPPSTAMPTNGMGVGASAEFVPGRRQHRSGHDRPRRQLPLDDTTTVLTPSGPRHVTIEIPGISQRHDAHPTRQTPSNDPLASRENLFQNHLASRYASIYPPEALPEHLRPAQGPAPYMGVPQRHAHQYQPPGNFPSAPRPQFDYPTRASLSSSSRNPGQHGPPHHFPFQSPQPGQYRMPSSPPGLYPQPYHPLPTGAELRPADFAASWGSLRLPDPHEYPAPLYDASYPPNPAQLPGRIARNAATRSQPAQYSYQLQSYGTPNAPRVPLSEVMYATATRTASPPPFDGRARQPGTYNYPPHYYTGVARMPPLAQPPPQLTQLSDNQLSRLKLGVPPIAAEYEGSTKARRMEQLEADECVICAESLKEEGPCEAPCGHVFCIDCIVRWVWRNPSCPICRHPARNHDLLKLELPSGDERENTETDEKKEQVEQQKKPKEWKGKGKERAKDDVPVAPMD